MGALALVEDLGRPGHGASGVGRSGAADRAALTLANRLVANDGGRRGRRGGVRRARRPGDARLLTVALAGAAAPATVDGTPVGHHAVVDLRPGQVLRLGMPPTGLRTYLAVRGGIDVAPVLGSRSTDTLSGLGPRSAADRATCCRSGRSRPSCRCVDVAPVCPPPGDTVVLRAVLGPRADFVADPAELTAPRGRRRAAATGSACGWRAAGCGGPATREVPSEGMVRGAIQVPPGGEPVRVPRRPSRDRRLPGGRRRCCDADVDRAAQVRPGQSVRFVVVPPSWKDTP